MIDWPVNLPTLNSRSAGIATNAGINSSGEVSAHDGAGETRSFLLRPLGESDIDTIFQACQDPTISAFTRIPYPYDREMAEEFVRESAFAYLNRVGVHFAIEVDGHFAGTIGLHTLKLSDHCAEVGYWITDTYRGKGICTEALLILTDFSLNVMRFRRLEALADFDNQASQRVLERAGYNRDGLLQSRVTKPDGRQIDMVLFSKVNA
jgi:ribosomal-protein-alanine N-acetyltransferase